MKQARKTRKQTKRNRRTRRHSQKGGAIQRVIIKANFELLDRTNNSVNNNNINNHNNHNNDNSNNTNNENSNNNPSNTPNNNSNRNNVNRTNNPQQLNTENPTQYNNTVNSNTEKDDIIEWYEDHGFEIIGMYGGTNPMIEHSENDTYIISYTPDPTSTKSQIRNIMELIVDIDENGNYPIEKDGRTYLVYGEIVSIRFE